jgi:glycosyl hydrolase group 75 (putative chitosanase)
METARLFNGLEVHSKVTTFEGDPAVIGRKTPDAYLLDLEVKIRLPKPAQSLEQLALTDPLLALILPGIKEDIPKAKVSNFYYGLYQLKVDAVNRALGRLDQIISRHNFFDCNTILELSDARTNRKALLIQSDMDVNADGSDADRYTEVDSSSANFQPFTSYRWPKKSNKPSQFAPEREEKLKQLQAEYDAKTTAADRKKILKEQIDQVQRELSDLKKYSFLIAKIDPYVVLPGFMFRQPNHSFLPKLGDCVIVSYQGKLYPALLGDVGPSYKIGEASLRICAQLDPRSTPYNRPASDLSITYIVFPGSAEDPPGPPDLKKLYDRCATLLGEIGGYAGVLWEWEDLLAKATPSPTPPGSPAASASADPSPSPEPSPRGSPSAKSTPSSSPSAPIGN